VPYPTFKCEGWKIVGRGKNNPDAGAVENANFQLTPPRFGPLV
jgi:hypothetical protein